MTRTEFISQWYKTLTTCSDCQVMSDEKPVCPNHLRMMEKDRESILALEKVVEFLSKFFG